MGVPRIVAHEIPKPISQVFAMQCTWSGCDQEGLFPRTDDFGETWATLCPTHNEQFNDIEIASLKFPSNENLKRLIGAWVRAQGGAEKAANRYMNWVSENPPRMFS